MTRQVVLDTETTGLNAKLGDRVIEIGCVEILDRRISDRIFHAYLNPEREVELGATRVHGLTREDLMAKPKFAEVAKDFLEFVAGAEIIIHNADFDVEFLDLELGRARLKAFREHVGSITDTLFLSRELNPGRKASLDALCERYGVDNTRRTIHGALLDAQLLADCWVAMTRGQETLDILMAESGAPSVPIGQPGTRPAIRVLRATVEELAAHAALCERLAKAAGGRCVWNEPAPA